MNRQSLDLSGKIDAALVEIFGVIFEVASSMSIPFFVVGARARDIILEKAYGIPTIRATQDVDFGVKVPDWDAYAKLKEGLIATQKFRRDKKNAQRLLYKGNFKVDVIPFGKISHPGDRLLWPPDQEIEMSTLGFEETSQHAITVKMRSEPPLEVDFVSLAGLAILKIIAWADSRPQREKDAKDLLFVMKKYLDAGNQERLHAGESDLTETDTFEYERASARLLGRDMAAILRPKTREALLKALEKETNDQSHYTLIENMLKQGGDSSNFEEALMLVQEMIRGINERP